MQQKCPEKAIETSNDQIRQSGCAARAYNLLKSLQVGEKN